MRAAAKGNFQVKIAVINPGLSTAAAAIAIGGPPETPMPIITPALLREIPRRISDPQGNPGDMVNIFVVGSKINRKMFSAQPAGSTWIVPSRTPYSNAVIDSLEKKDYLTMPMSTLFLFHRRARLRLRSR